MDLTSNVLALYTGTVMGNPQRGLGTYPATQRLVSIGYQVLCRNSYLTKVKL